MEAAKDQPSASVSNKSEIEDMQSDESMDTGLQAPTPEPERSQSNPRASLDDDLDLSDESEQEDEEAAAVNSVEMHSRQISTSHLFEASETSGIKNANMSDSDDDKIPSNAALLQSPSKVVVDRIKYRNLLDELLGDFKKRHRRTNKQLEHTRIKVHEQRTSFDHETYKTILEKNVKKLLKGATEQEFAHLCAELCQGDKELHQRMFCDYVYTFLMVGIKILQTNDALKDLWQNALSNLSVLSDVRT